VLARHLDGLVYGHDPRPLQEAAAHVPDEFVDAVTLAGPPDDVAAGVIRLARSGIGQFMLYPLAPDGRIEHTIERFQREVMPRVREAGL
jgi:alkanesulfonate monooxygenase SsuD/methylene tetrahydromethanopterin reductase-like flavin-dependent oxidoreductase (luciferase family)